MARNDPEDKLLLKLNKISHKQIDSSHFSTAKGGS